MKFKTPLLIFFGLVLFSCKELPKEKKSDAENLVIEAEHPAVPSSYSDLEGNPIELAEYKGKRVLLNYWATWCRPCIEEMPDLLKLQAILEQENYVFLLASDESVEKIKTFKAARGFDFKFITYNGTYGAQQINALPVTFIYNEIGEQVFRFDGAMDWNTPELIEQLKILD
ncbi:TlpA family protein disulfide reductase [Maribacter antarcticus]|uniref:TlpA family protein disulfide reductase n=1 Tax=Maribacter antarcticus TaxID=505250 RepID=UPI00047DCA4A|nr:TlpA disulfide reductase family protein [Maribacter antarcticus]